MYIYPFSNDLNVLLRRLSTYSARVKMYAYSSRNRRPATSDGLETRARLARHELRVQRLLSRVELLISSPEAVALALCLEAQTLDAIVYA